MGKENEYKRTCNRCSTTWFVAASELKGPGLGELIDHGVSFSPSIRGLRKRQVGVRDLRRRSDERIKDLGRCPQCRSTDYTQVRA